MKKETLNPKKLFNSTQFGFSQIVKVPMGKMIFISGQVAWDEQANIIGKGDLAIQTQQAIDNLKIAMEVAGGSLVDVVMLRIYIVNHQRENGSIISNALLRNFDNNALPASTWVNVQGLAHEDFLIEIEAQAMI